MIYVVLGMHKSGTTLISNILHHSDINMGDFNVQRSYDQGNQYEREDTLALNKDILGLTSYRIIDKPVPTVITLTATQRTRMQEIIQTCNQKHTIWGFKDPRTTLTYSLWKSELPAHKIIAIYRTPSEIWPRFRYSGWKEAYLNPQNAWNCIDRWCEHNQRILDTLYTTPMPYIILNYQTLMATTTEFERLQTFIGQPLNDQRKSNLYRSRQKRYILLDIITQLYQQRTGYHPDHIMEQLEILRGS
ncbi:sulfotransferase [Anaerolineales bacterium HSG25]|nr:sulfotransferase [Anaerolineales bacterium HSG25]